mmetsp:Transcript_17219/g.43294  ORF Transcript_17219/g.43294 Transcript_17219/m.43294 type:complete len:217 (-) Transcript_17219:333-983(-)
MVKGVARRPRVKNNGARDLLHKHKARHATACSFGVQLGHGVGATCMRLSSLFCQGLPECHQSTDSAVACVALMLQLPMDVLHLVMPLPEHAHGGESLDVMRSAEVHLPGAVHLGEANPAICLIMLVMNHGCGFLPCWRQTLAPWAPWSKEVYDHDIILLQSLLKRILCDRLSDMHIGHVQILRFMVHNGLDLIQHRIANNRQVRIQRELSNSLGKI